MDISVPSRFACLKIEEDDFRPSSNNKIKKKSDSKQPKKASNGNQPSKKLEKLGHRVPSQTAKKSKSKKPENGKQWEEWKRRDDELVNDNFEQQLHSAILQSKLDFEREKKNIGKNDMESQVKKNNKKGKTMSLDQFLDPGVESQQREKMEKIKVQENDRDFFKEVVETARLEITKEKVEEGRKKRQEHFEEVISLAQCQEKLEKERERSSILGKELEEARKEIALVKKRNTTLCSMLSQGEMKDKAAVLLELEKLTAVKEELTEEVSRLHKLLEQERSNKITASVSEKSEKSDYAKHNKDKTKKKKN
ncbi:G kinase-anchoring protein 1-like isoform X2 [Cylas formicarius]|uniref:G kinase-anchoring protein 1-like isoform X2 n=1 Tax=Cylas formicarius TaxID=197179 RepID=UPI002958ACA2|nr:G kinase-anchoring protein 1-like isoform X2 [Cylas formicarius]